MTITTIWSSKKHFQSRILFHQKWKDHFGNKQNGTIMEIDIVTRQDLKAFKSEILEEFRAILQEQGNQMNSTDHNWLRSAEVRKMLRISPGTLQNLRIKGTLPYRKIGGTMYYQSQDIHNMMKGRRDNG